MAASCCHSMDTPHMAPAIAGRVLANWLRAGFCLCQGILAESQEGLGKPLSGESACAGSLGLLYCQPSLQHLESAKNYLTDPSAAVISWHVNVAVHADNEEATHA